MRPLTSGLALVFFYSNVLAPPLAQASFWEERRQAVENGVRHRIPDAPSSPGSLNSVPDPDVAWLASAIGPYGAIRDIHLIPSHPPSASQRLVILLQDAHEVVEAQANIARILEPLVNQHGVALIGVEGAHGPFDLKLFRAFHHREAVKDVANHLLERAYLSGPEYVGITSPKAPLLWGVDDPTHYVANVQAFKTTLPQEPQALAAHATLVQTLDAFKAQLSTPRLAAFDAKRLATTPAQRQLRTLNRQAALLKKLFQHSLTPHEWAEYQRQREAIRELPQRLTELTTALETPSPDLRSPSPSRGEGGGEGDQGELAMNSSESLVQAETLLTFLDPFERFYLEADARNQALVTNLLAKMDELQTPSPFPLPPGERVNPDVAVLVAGGFHTPGLQTMLKKQNIAFVTITPRLTKVPDGTRYLDVFTRDRTPLEQLLLGEKLFVHSPYPLAQYRLVPTAGSDPHVLRRLFILLLTLTQLLLGISIAAMRDEFTALVNQGLLPESVFVDLPGSAQGFQAVHAFSLPVTLTVGFNGGRRFAVTGHTDRTSTHQPGPLKGQLTVGNQPYKFTIAEQASSPLQWFSKRATTQSWFIRHAVPPAKKVSSKRLVLLGSTLLLLVALAFPSLLLGGFLGMVDKKKKRPDIDRLFPNQKTNLPASPIVGNIDVKRVASALASRDPVTNLHSVLSEVIHRQGPLAIPPLYGHLGQQLAPDQLDRLGQVTFEMFAGLTIPQYADSLRSNTATLGPPGREGIGSLPTEGPRIVTWTPNPTLNLSFDFAKFPAQPRQSPEGINLVPIEPSGKGINMSVALRRWGLDPVTAGIVGGFPGAVLIDRLQKLGVPTGHMVEVPADTRLYLIVHANHQGQIEVACGGGTISEPDLAKAEQVLWGSLKKGDLLLLAGSAPRGAPRDYYVKLVRKAKDIGVITYLDTRGEPLKHAIAEHPDLVGVNVQEFASFLGVDPSELMGNIQRIAAEAQDLVDQGIHTVIISMGADGMVVSTREDNYWVHPPAVTEVSSVGAGDTIKVAFAYGTLTQMPLMDVLRLASAASALTVTLPGTQMADLDPAKQLMGDVRIERLGKIRVTINPLASAPPTGSVPSVKQDPEKANAFVVTLGGTLLTPELTLLLLVGGAVLLWGCLVDLATASPPSASQGALQPQGKTLAKAAMVAKEFKSQKTSAQPVSAAPSLKKAAGTFLSLILAALLMALSWSCGAPARGGRVRAPIADQAHAVEVQPSIAALINDLRDPATRAAATNALVAVGHPAIVPLVEALKDDAPDLRAAVVYTLGLLRHERALPAVLRALTDDHWWVRLRVTGALHSFAGTHDMAGYAIRSLEPLAERGDVYRSLLDVWKASRALDLEIPWRLRLATLKEIIANRRLTQPDDRRLAVVVYPQSDWNSAFYRTEYIDQLTQHGYRVVYYEAKTDDELVRSIRHATQRQQTSLLVIGGHGTKDSTSLGEQDPRWWAVPQGHHTLDRGDERWLKRSGISASLATGGQIILVSCRTGQGAHQGKNVANMWRRVFPQAKPGGIWAPKEDSPGFITLTFDEANEVTDVVFGERKQHVPYRASDPSSWDTVLKELQQTFRPGLTQLYERYWSQWIEVDISQLLMDPTMVTVQWGWLGMVPLWGFVLVGALIGVVIRYLLDRRQVKTTARPPRSVRRAQQRQQAPTRQQQDSVDELRRRLLWGVMGVGVGVFSWWLSRRWQGPGIPGPTPTPVPSLPDQAPSPTADVEKAMAHVKQHLGGVTPHQLRQEGLPEFGVAWVVTHQLLAFGQDVDWMKYQPERIKYLLSLLEFDPQGRPHFPMNLEGHPGQFVADLAASGVGLEQEFVLEGNKVVTLRQLIEGLRDRYDHLSIQLHDPSWLIEALSLIYTLEKRWVSQNNVKTSIGHYVASAFRRMLDAGGEPSRAGLVENGVHYAGSIAKVVKRFKDDPGTFTRKQLPAYLNILEKFKTQRFILHLEGDSADFEQPLRQFHRLVTGQPHREQAPAVHRLQMQEAAYQARSRFNQLGHILELALDPDSAYYGEFPESDLSVAVNALAAGINLWYSPEFSATREALAAFKLPDDIPLRLALKGDLLHAYRAFSLWKHRQEKQGLPAMLWLDPELLLSGLGWIPLALLMGILARTGFFLTIAWWETSAGRRSRGEPKVSLIGHPSQEEAVREVAARLATWFLLNERARAMTSPQTIGERSVLTNGLPFIDGQQMRRAIPYLTRRELARVLPNSQAPVSTGQSLQTQKLCEEKYRDALIRRSQV